MHVFLETDRLVLRRFTPDDADALLALDRDPLVRRYVEDGEPVNMDEAVSSIGHFLAYHDRSDVYGFWVAIEKATAEFLGWFHFRPHADAPQDEPELGYRLVSSSWGKGYATEGSQALVDRGFESPAVSRIYAETMVVNVASWRVMEKVGMREVRRFHAEWPVRIDGDEHGDVEFAITRAEWEAQHRTGVRPV